MKQVLYGSLYLAILVGVGALAYGRFITSTARCVNDRIDKGEEGIDCGGICANACIPSDVRTIELIDNVRMFHASPRTLEMMARIQNANSDFAAKSFRYRFDVKGSDGTVVDTVYGESFIYAGEVKYLVVVKTNVAYTPATADLTIESPDWIGSGEYKRPSLSGVQDQRVETTANTISVSGKATNKDVVRVAALRATALFYDDLGIPVGVSETEIGSIGPEETAEFTILHPAIPNASLSRTQVILTAARP